MAKFTRAQHGDYLEAFVGLVIDLNTKDYDWRNDRTITPLIQDTLEIARDFGYKRLFDSYRSRLETAGVEFKFDPSPN